MLVVEKDTKTWLALQYDGENAWEIIDRMERYQREGEGTYAYFIGWLDPGGWLVARYPSEPFVLSDQAFKERFKGVGM